MKDMWDMFDGILNIMERVFDRGWHYFILVGAVVLVIWAMSR